MTERLGSPQWSCPARGSPPRPTTTSGATAIGLDLDDRRGRDDRGARALAQPPEVRGERRAAPVPHAASSADRRRRRAAPWVTLDGIFYQGDVWLDGAYLGDPEGYFFPHSFDITDSPARRRTRPRRRGHVLAAARPSRRRNITGVLQQSEWFDRVVQPGRAVATGAALRHRAGAHRPAPGALPRRRRAARPPPPRRRGSTATPSGRCVIRTIVDGSPTPRPTHGAGERRERARVDASTSPTRRCGGRARSATSRSPRSRSRSSSTASSATAGQRRTGLRQVSWDDWVCSVNGERLFLKGANLLPTSSDLADADAGADRATTSSRRSTSGSTCSACTATSPPPASTTPPTSSACCCCRTSRCSGATPDRFARRRSTRPAALVDSLGHHPSIVQWSAHDDPTLSSIAPQASNPAEGRPAGCARRRASSCRRGTSRCSTAG